MNEMSATIKQIPTNDTVNDNFQSDAKNTTDIENKSEKYDTSPENLEKSSCDITPNDDLSTSVSGMTTIPTTNETISSSSVADQEIKQSDNDQTTSKNKSTGFAFTIDFGERKAVDNRKFKEISERFQHRQQQQQEQRRHRRGVSLSKLDDSRKLSTSINNMENSHISADDSIVPTSMSTKPPFKQRAKLDDAKSDEKCDTKVVLRRPKPTTMQALNCKDSAKRHSWSPRSSGNFEKLSQTLQDNAPKEQPIKCIENINSTGFQPKSTILQRALDNNSLRPSSKTTIKTKFQEKISSRDHVITAPLEYVRNSDDDGSIGDASQATYTLDGDNYTEEEKERMSIDRLGKKTFDLSIESRTINEFNKKIVPSLRNTTQVNNYGREMKTDSRHSQRNSVDRDQQSTASSKSSPKPAKSYLDKIKSRVKTIGDCTFNRNTSKPSTNEKLMKLKVVRTDDSTPVTTDHGVFTSITACGVLNKQSQENIPTSFPSHRNRKQSLIKFEIDSSEYIQPKVDESVMNSFTDYEKAKQNEYKLNIFSTVNSYTSSGTSPVQTDDDNLSVECVEDMPISIKTAPTKNDWIQEWAKNARRRNHLLASSASASPKMHHYPRVGPVNTEQGKDDDRMSQSYDTYFHNTEQFGDDAISSDEFTANANRNTDQNKAKAELVDQKQSHMHRPPASPTKIPSPMQSQIRARSSSVNRNSKTNFENLETEMYLEKTAAAISSLQKIHRINNSPQSPLSPMRKTESTNFDTVSSISARNNYEQSVNLKSIRLHKRNLSLDVPHNATKPRNYDIYCSDEKFNTQELDNKLNKRHIRHKSYENKHIQLNSPKHTNIDQTRTNFIDQQHMLNKYFDGVKRNEEHARRSSAGDVNGSPIRRSSSFCNRNIVNTVSTKITTPTSTKKIINRGVSSGDSNLLQKSASSSSFKKCVAASSFPQSYEQNENKSYYINGKDNLQATRDDLYYSSNESDDGNSFTGENGRYESDAKTFEPPISHTRYNKAFLMRMEQNKQVATGGANKGVVACPNTPELPRRNSNQRASFRDRPSMPRDSSLSRMKQDLPGLQATKKALTQTVSKDSSSSTSSVKQRILPKYMDISKYKPVQGQTFLKRDESKSTLINRNEIRKSPSAIGLSKGDSTRSSGRVKSAGAKPASTPVATKDSKAREAELAMWRRRATYDPMKAAAEGRKKQEEAKKTVQSNKFGDNSAVFRSQSFHSGVGQFNNLQLRQQFREDSFNKDRWTVMSTESSDGEEFGDNT